MTKQATGELIRHLSHAGYLNIGNDPSDGRVRRVSLTDHGWAAIELSERVIDEFDTWLAAAVGPRRVSQLRRTLLAIIELDPDESPTDEE